ncbi:hypothetical protein Slin14017_G000310 [Septoria linicola]|nr:hypothetical protein Slin14017_G000310 [Septoria linicola]
MGSRREAEQQKSSRQTIVDAMDAAKAAGYDCHGVDVNPKDPEDTLRRIKDELQKRHCDLFIIGFAVRGNPDYTSMFEQLVNTSVEVSPKTKFGFMPKPTELYPTILRILS